MARAYEFSWEATARLTLEAYGDAAGSRPPAPCVRYSNQEIAHAIHKTLGYAALFDYPLKTAEIYDAEVARWTPQQINPATGEVIIPAAESFKSEKKALGL